MRGINQACNGTQLDPHDHSKRSGAGLAGKGAGIKAGIFPIIPHCHIGKA